MEKQRCECGRTLYSGQFLAMEKHYKELGKKACLVCLARIITDDYQAKQRKGNDHGKLA